MENRANRENWYVYGNACILTRECERAGAKEASAQNGILFLHGRFADGLGWDPLSEYLGSQASCRSMELPGFGRSFCLDEREMAFRELIDLVKEVTRASIEFSPEARWLLVGHDLGALIVQLAALELARPVDLVLINPISLAPISHARRTWLSRLLPRRYRLPAEPVSDRSVVRRLVETWPGPMERGHWRRKMREFPGSVLVLSSALDPLTSADVARGIFNTYPHAEFFEHPDRKPRTVST